MSEEQLKEVRFDHTWPEVLERLMSGENIGARRSGWNGNGLWVTYQSGKKLKNGWELGPHFHICDGWKRTVNIWVPSVSDTLGKDWHFIDIATRKPC